MRVYSLNRVEHIVAKGEIAHHEQFLLLPQCFQKSSASNAPECDCKWKRVGNSNKCIRYKVNTMSNQKFINNQTESMPTKNIKQNI